jgi:hypothetical protein
MIGPVLAAERRAFANGLRDPGRRGLLGVAAIVLLGLASGAAWRLTGLFLAWRSAGVLESRLWGVCLVTWAAAGALGTLALREQAVGEQARLLFTLPLSPAERARALFVSAAARLVNFWLLSLGGLGTALVVVLGVRALPWIALILLGPGLVLGLALGPLADRLGRLYERAFQALLGANPRPRRRRFVHLLTRGLARRRTPAAALLARELLSRGRHWVDWARLGLVAGSIAGFPRLRPALLAHGLPDALTIPGTVALLAFLFLVDGSSSPIGAEGNRLALLLTAPLSPGELLRAKLAALLAPLLLGGVAAALLLGALAGLGGSELAAGVVASGLLVTGLAALFAWGSAWDGDLGLEIETGLQGLLQEQSPLTPVRAFLVALGGLFLAAGIGGLAAFRTLPATLGLAALAGLDVLVLGLAWRAGLGGLRRLTS